jgi:hypothetical protein
MNQRLDIIMHGQVPFDNVMITTMVAKMQTFGNSLLTNTDQSSATRKLESGFAH